MSDKKSNLGDQLKSFSIFQEQYKKMGFTPDISTKKQDVALDKKLANVDVKKLEGESLKTNNWSQVWGDVWVKFGVSDSVSDDAITNDVDEAATTSGYSPR